MLVRVPAHRYAYLVRVPAHKWGAQSFYETPGFRTKAASKTHFLNLLLKTQNFRVKAVTLLVVLSDPRNGFVDVQ